MSGGFTGAALVARVDGFEGAAGFEAGPTALIAPTLLSGAACVAFGSTLWFDLRLLRGKVGCRTSAFLFYLPARYLGILSIVLLMVYNDTLLAMELTSVRRVCWALSMLSAIFSSAIMVVKSSSLARHSYFMLAQELLWLGFAIIQMRLLGYTRNPSMTPHQLGWQFADGAIAVVLSTCNFAAPLYSVFWKTRDEHHFNRNDCWKMATDACILEFGTVWVLTTLTCILFFFDQNKNAWRSFTTSSVSYIVSLVISWRIYHKFMMHTRHSASDTQCPFADNSVLLPVVRASFAFVSAKLNLPARSAAASGALRAVFPKMTLGCCRGPRIRSVEEGRVSIVTTSRRPGTSRGARTHQRACRPEDKSHSTYAQTSLFDSRAG
ncbi:uncharacterized protein BXZ73DRAFT_100535 [Epithele typhae]|uniref:uncharacterized protein n=1 Tax=Epithele typhae TaxID=378194 RepID=UPI002008C8D3|nr:uncharacterized protein BXZ73DRAFT_100535 [Epithele typhae]KAH9935147.1 hypothetical protein BXZ73DRAFT_100535 [Epithele typhae]